MRRFFVLILLVQFCFCTTAQNPFSRTYGFGLVNAGKCVIQTSDNGFAICGSTTPSSGGQTDFYLVKTDINGVAQFHFAYGGSGIDQTSVLIQMPDSGYLMAGYSNSYSANNDYDVLVVRTDKNGNSIWYQYFGTPDWDFIYDMKPTPDGNFILAGSTYGSPGGLLAGYLVKIDASGNKLWEKFIDMHLNVNLKQIAVLPDGRMITCGNLSMSADEPYDGFLAFVDTNGDTTQTTIIDFGKHESINAIDFFSNGDIALAGTSIDPTNQDNADEMIIRTDTNGVEIWSSTFSGPLFFGMDETNDLSIHNDTLATFGSTSSNGLGGYDFHMTLFESTGAYIRGGTFGGPETERCYSGIIIDENLFAMVGLSTTFGPGAQSVFFVKSDSDFTFINVIIKTDELRKTSTLDIYPNPVSDQVNINYNGEVKATVSLYDERGIVVLNRKEIVIPCSINASEINNGIYFLEIISDGFSEKRKLVISR